MQLILISGKICSGKSTISKCLQKKGYSYINSDVLAKDLILNNISLKKKLQKDGLMKELRMRQHFEKPSLKRQRKHKENIRRCKKEQRLKDLRS